MAPNLTSRDIESFRKVVDICFNNLKFNLEDIATNVNNLLPEAGARTSPEYILLVKSIEDYQTNIQRKLGELTNEYTKTDDPELTGRWVGED
jgi:hypothetical protein